ncbi:MAG TPA: zf-TFIIB domain-containing protein [Candidatus Competibacteraceae bacterium]|nr:zf-TFIIB domain-containing protein [Candidatus Competibacteraceae bacterium]
MKCPVCADMNLVMSERQGIEIDYCPQCRGVWLDRGELDKLIERTLTAMPAGVPPREAPVAPSPAPPGYSPEPRRAYPEEPSYRHQKKRGFLGDLFDFD